MFMRKNTTFAAESPVMLRNCGRQPRSFNAPALLGKTLTRAAERAIHAHLSSCLRSGYRTVTFLLPADCTDGVRFGL